MDDQFFPFCPQADCIHHRIDPNSPYSDFQPWGFYLTTTFGLVPRFRCNACGHTFSTQTFSVDYYAKRRISYSDLLLRLVSTSGLRALGRAIHSSSDSVSNRISRAARQALALDSRLSSSRLPSENLAADGFESFCVSKYFPNNINLLVGSESQFVYGVDHVTLRRKGRMTENQKARRTELETQFKADPMGVERSFSRLVVEDALRVLSDEGRPSLRLFTDEHRAYPRAIAHSPCAEALHRVGRLVHETISSRVQRTIANPLFPVNYLDREIRKDLHEHVRESVCFGRNVNRQMERLVVYLFYHNYLKVHRTRWKAFSHAAVAGYEVGTIERELEGIWKQRSFLSLTDLTESMRETWLRQRKTPLGKELDYLPQYAYA